jgi:hypothetical protein
MALAMMGEVITIALNFTATRETARSSRGDPWAISPSTLDHKYQVTSMADQFAPITAMPTRRLINPT